MKIYTGGASGGYIETMQELNVGCLISSSPTQSVHKDIGKVHCALDNGAFSCWRRGFPFQRDVFLEQMRKAYRSTAKLEFIVCPDIVAGGLDSLKFSLEWAASDTLKTARNLYLPVQDGMRPGDLTTDISRRFAGLFVGGSNDWKWKHAATWAAWAHARGMVCHIGRCGSLNKLIAAYEAGADSVDSTSFVQDESWHIIQEFQAHERGELTLLC